MGIVYRTSGAWGAGKGAQLTPDEIDSNFYELLMRVLAAEANPAHPVNIASFTISGTQFSVIMSDSTVQGPFTLPIATFKWRGKWAPATMYAPLDLFYLDDQGLYVVSVAHTSGSTFDPAIQISLVACLVQLLGPTTIYDMAFYYPGVPGAGLASGSPLFQFVAPRACYIPASSTASDQGSVYMATPPTGNLSFAIAVNGGTAAGHVIVPSGSNVGYIDLAANLALNAGDVLTFAQTSTPSGAGLSVSMLTLRGTAA